MTEQVLKDYFDGKISADVLASDLKDSRIQMGHTSSSVQITSISDNEEFEITKEHLSKLCNDTLLGFLSTTDLNIVAFALMASDYFYWDTNTKEGEIVGQTVLDWDNPEINFPLTVDNLQLWKAYLESGEYLLKKNK